MQFVIFLSSVNLTSREQDLVSLKQERRYPQPLSHSHNSPYFIIIIEQGPFSFIKDHIRFKKKHMLCRSASNKMIIKYNDKSVYKYIFGVK
jgi:hypothetical protein